MSGGGGFGSARLGSGGCGQAGGVRGAGLGLCGRRGGSGPGGVTRPWRFPRSSEAVVVERRAGGGEEPCVLQLECRPPGEMVCVGVLSEARNMEVYVGEEYCGTGRGQSLGTACAPG